MFGSGSGAFSGGASNTSGFGQSAFGKPPAPAVFGQQNTSLFNQTTQPNTGLFGSTAAAPAFGQTPTAQPTFGGFNTSGTSLFGTPTAAPASSGGLFGQQNASMVGNTGGGLFGSSNANTSFGQSKPVGTGFSFGAPAAQPTGNIFGTPQTSTAGSGIFGASATGTFGSTSGFGATSAGGTTIKFNPVTGTDTMVKNGVNQTINTRHQSITVMKEYETKIFEELRFEDYCANRKVGQQGAVSGGLFGSPKTLFSSTTTTSTGLFGANDNKPMFGATSTTPALGGFGNTGTSNVFGAQNSIFGKPQQSTPAFGAQTSTQSFGMNTTQPSIFGSNTAQTSKPFGVAAPQTNIFGSTPSTSTFGTQPTGFGQTGFGQPNQNNLFGQNKPAFGLGSTQTTTGFGFGTNTSTSANGLFGSKPSNTGFQMNTPSFGANNAFGATSTAQPAAGSLFGSNAFNKAPTTSLFSQSANQQTGVFNNTAKPGGLFGQGTQGTGLFGSSNTNTFGAGGTSFFGNNQQPSGIGLFGNTNNVQLSTNQVSQSNQIQLQLDTLKAMPYGDSPLFKRFYKDVSKIDDSSLVKTQNLSLEKFGSYKVSPIPTPKSTPQIRRNFPQFNRKSLFDGLEESPPSTKNRDKINDNSLLLNISSPKSSCKKLNLKKDANDSSKLTNGSSMIMHTKPLAKLESYFSNKHNSPGGTSNKADLSLNEENNTIVQLHSNKQINLTTSKGTDTSDTFQNNDTDTVVIDDQESSIDPNVPQEDHPTGIKLKRVGYYTIPPMNELAELIDEDGLCMVNGFTIGRYDYGNVYFPDRFNVAGLDLDSIVHIRHREVIIYQDDEVKPPLGEGLNRKATVTLDRVWPNDKTTKQPITDPSRIAATNFVAKLQKACATLGTQFVDYRYDTGSWVFNVEHFSKYGLIDSDDEDIEEKVVDHSIDTKSIVQKPKIVKPSENISPKQNITKPLLDLSVGLDRTQSPHQYLLKSSIQFPTVNQLTNSSNILHYYDNNKENSINITAQLTQNMNLQAHKIQCMKASFDDIFYEEIETMDQDDDIYEQKDKFEDKLEKILETIPEYIISPRIEDSLSKSKSLITPIDNQGSPKFFISKQRKKIVQAVDILRPVLTAPLQAQRFNLKYDCSICLPFEIQLNNTCESSKLELLNSLSLKIPWSNGLTFLTLNTKSKEVYSQTKGIDISLLATELSGRRKDDYSSTVLQKVQVITPFQTETFIELLTEHLKICMTNSICDTNNDNIPYFYPKFGVDALHSHCYLLSHFSELSEEESYGHVWELIKALWGDPENLYTKDCPQEHLYNMARRQAVSDWLETLLEKTIDFKSTHENTSQRLFKLVSSHKIMEACELAISNSESNLAMLLAQLGSENSVRCCIQRQLWQWSNSKADLFIDIHHLKLYTMIAGQPLFDSNQGIVNVCENLDWVRAFALHMWYIQPPSSTIGDALDAYQKSFDGDDSYSCKPFKLHNSSVTNTDDDKFTTYDVCYHLLKLYTNSAYEMYQILNPLTHTQDPLDFNFSWLLYNTLQSLGYTHMSEIYANQLHLSFASQLVSHGLWQWAVFILLHIKDEQLRESSIEEIIGRNVETPVGDVNKIIFSEKEQFLVEKLNIKEEKIYNAKAILATTHKQYLEAAICYLKAELWQDAHNIIMNNILPNFILKKDSKSTLKRLLGQLVEGSRLDGSIPTTMQDSLTMLEYLRLSEKLSKMSAEKSIMHIASLCERVACFSENTVEEKMIKNEVSRSIVQQIGQQISKIEPANRRILKSLVDPLNKLSKPEDYVLDEVVHTVSQYM